MDGGNPQDNVADFVRIDREGRAQAGHGVLTPQQEIRLNLNQSICAHKIDGKVYLFAVSLAASHRLYALADKRSCPPAITMNPFTIATSLRAIEILSDEEYLNMVRVVQDVLSGPIDAAEIQRIRQEEELSRLEVYEVYMKSFETVLKPSMLPVVGGDPATAYERSVVLAVAINLKQEFTQAVKTKQQIKRAEVAVMTRVGTVVAALQQQFQQRAAPYNAPAGGGAAAGGAGKGGAVAAPQKGVPKGGKVGGGGKGAPPAGGGKGKGTGIQVCLDWCEGNCPGTGRATCPSGHVHQATIGRLDFLNTRFLGGRLTPERMAILCREVDNS
eukprot:g8873.t1